MNNKTSLLLVGSLVLVCTILGFGDQQASAFEPTQQELKVMKTVASLKINMDKLDSSNSTYWSVVNDFYNARIALNKMGIYTEDQEPHLIHLMDSQYNNTRQYAQAMNGTDIQDRPPIIKPCNCPNKTKTIYVASGYKDPYIVFGVTLYAQWIGDSSNAIKTGETIFSTFTPKWKGLNQGIIPYCKVGSSTLPAVASYDVNISMAHLINGPVLIPYKTVSENENFSWHHPTQNTEFAKQNNVKSQPTITCTLNKVSVK